METIDFVGMPTHSVEPVAPVALILIFLVAMLVSLAVSALMIVAFWKISAKAGFSGALGLLMLVPLGNVILPLFLAFAEWPAMKDKRVIQTEI